MRGELTHPIYIRRDMLARNGRMIPAFARALEGWERALTANDQIAADELAQAGQALADLLLKVLEDGQVGAVLRQQAAVQV